jgi:hypothetical protein
VSKRLGYDPFSESATGSVQVRVGAGNSGLEGRVEWHDNAGNWAGERVFPSRTQDCPQLIRAMGFALAVQIQLLAVVAGPTEPGAGLPDSNRAPKRSKPSEPTRPAPVNAAPERSAETGNGAQPPTDAARASVFVVSGGSLGYGLASSAAGSVRFASGLSWRHAQLELGGELFLPVTTRRADGAAFTQRLILGSAAGCAVYEPLSACLLAKGGVVHVAGRDVDLPASSSGAVFEAGVRLAARAFVHRSVFLAPRVECLFNVARWTVTIDDTSVWSAPRVAAMVGLDVGMLFR